MAMHLDLQPQFSENKDYIIDKAWSFQIDIL